MAPFTTTPLSLHLALTPSIISSSSKPAHPFPNPLVKTTFQPLLTKRRHNASFSTRVVERDKYETDTTDLLQQNQRIEQTVQLLKSAAKTRKVAAEEVLSALSLIKEEKIDPSPFLDTLGGTESPGRTWMLIFTSQDQLKRGSYFPVTAVQRFDAAAKRIENGVYLGPLGCLTFEGRFSWKKRILAFIFECIRIKIGPFDPLQITLGKKEEREPSTNDPFFIWFYVDEEIAIAQGKGGGTAFWCRCRRVT